MNLNPDNWFWCDVCEVVSYNFKCECHATSCNGGGCDKCAEAHKLVSQTEKPKKEQAKQNNIKQWGSVVTPEERMLREIFGETFIEV